MSRMIKAFCTGQQRKDLTDQYGSVVDYDAFVLMDVSNAAAKKIAKLVPTEDITDQYAIQTGKDLIDTSIPRVTTAGKSKTHPSYKGIKKLSPGPHHHLVQFVGPIKKSWLAKIKRLGGEPRRHYADFAYVVRCDEATLSKIVELPYVRWAGHLSHRNRLFSTVDPEEKALPRSRYLPSVHVVEFFDRDDLKNGLKELKKNEIKILSSTPSSATAKVELVGTKSQQKKQLELISGIHGVSAIRNRSIKRTSNDVATGIMNGDSAWLETLGLTGSGETIAVCDTGIDSGDATNIHPDFDGRISAIQSFPITPDLDPFINNPGGDDGASDLDSGHGTHVAGSAMGNGQSSNSIAGQIPIRGLAHEANLVFQAVEQEIDWKSIFHELVYGRYLLAGIPDDLRPLFSSAYNEGARIHSNSWGGGDAGAYDEQCRQLDEFVWKKKDFCVVVAAGNDGTDPDENSVADGQINLTSVTSPATAKTALLWALLNRCVRILTTRLTASGGPMIILWRPSRTIPWQMTRSRWWPSAVVGRRSTVERNPRSLRPERSYFRRGRDSFHPATPPGQRSPKAISISSWAAPAWPRRWLLDRSLY